MTARAVPILKGPRVTLRPVEPGDVAARQALGYDTDITRSYGGNTRATSVMSDEEADHWVQMIGSYRYAWIIDAGGLIGHIRLHGLVEADQRAALAVGIDDPRRLGQGLGTEAIQLVVGYAIDALHLRRISLRVLEFNTRAIKAYESVGFIIEGRERRAALIDGKRHDDIMMGLLDDEFIRD